MWKLSTINNILGFFLSHYDKDSFFDLTANQQMNGIKNRYTLLVTFLLI